MHLKPLFFPQVSLGSVEINFLLAVIRPKCVKCESSYFNVRNSCVLCVSWEFHFHSWLELQEQTTSAYVICSSKADLMGLCLFCPSHNFPLSGTDCFLCFYADHVISHVLLHECELEGALHRLLLEEAVWCCGFSAGQGCDGAPPMQHCLLESLCWVLFSWSCPVNGHNGETYWQVCLKLA